MKNIFLMALFLLAFDSLVEAQVQITKEGLEKSYFSSLTADSLGLILKFQPNGIRYLMIPSENVSNYGEVVRLNFGDNLRLQDKDGYLKFSPLPKPLSLFGFFVESQFDARSFGGGVTKKEAIILVIPSVKNTGGGTVVEIKFIEPDLEKAKKILKS